MHSCASLLRDDLLSDVLPHSLPKKIELHTVDFSTAVASKLTSCINGNSTFNESLKLRFRFFENMFYRRGGQTLLVYDLTAELITHEVK
jgi:hypothetical protein